MTVVTTAPVDGPTCPIRHSSSPQRTENWMLSAGFPTVDWSGVSCMASRSNPAATRPSTYARPSPRCSVPQTCSATAVKTGRLSSALPSGTRAGAADGVGSAGAVAVGVGVAVGSGAHPARTAAETPATSTSAAARDGRTDLSTSRV